MNYKLCVDQTHAFGYQCARCDRTHCLTCDQPSDVEQVKTIVHYCQDWRCQREKQIEEGQLDVIPKKTLANVEKMRTALQELKTRALLSAPGSTSEFSPATAASIAIICEDALDGV